MHKHQSVVSAKSFKRQVVGCTYKETTIYIQHGNCALVLTESEFTDFALMITEASEKTHPIQGIFKNVKK